MRQSHAGGEKMFVDYAGDTVPIVVNRRNVREAHIFVAVMGGSSLSFASLRDLDRADARLNRGAQCRLRVLPGLGATSGPGVSKKFRSSRLRITKSACLPTIPNTLPITTRSV